MTCLSFDFHGPAGVERRRVPITDLVIAGWAGRDPHKVREHIDELALLGVAPPATTPCFYRAGTGLLTTAAMIDCLGAEASGEVEYILYAAEDGWWVGLGSDHTDRKVEAWSITVSKQMCPKPVAAALWRFEDVAGHWDALVLRAWVTEPQGRVLYQQGSLDALLDPRVVVRTLRETGQDFAPGTLMFGGTMPVIGGIRPRPEMELELHDPVLGRSLAHRYATRWLANA